MSDHYDVIIIGTGAGGGTLAHRLAPTGKRILLLERGGYLPREPENWDSAEVFLKERYLSGEERIDPGAKPLPERGVGDRPGRRAPPAAPAVIRRRQHEVLRRDPVPAAPGRFRRGAPLGGHVAGVADRLRGPRAVLRAGRGAVPRPRPGGRGPHRARALGPVPVSGGVARAAHPAALRRLRADRASAVSPARRRRPERVRPRGRQLRAVRSLRRLPVP